MDIDDMLYGVGNKFHPANHEDEENEDEEEIRENEILLNQLMTANARNKYLLSLLNELAMIELEINLFPDKIDIEQIKRKREILDRYEIKK